MVSKKDFQEMSDLIGEILMTIRFNYINGAIEIPVEYSEEFFKDMVNTWEDRMLSCRKKPLNKTDFNFVSTIPMDPERKKCRQ